MKSKIVELRRTLFKIIGGLAFMAFGTFATGQPLSEEALKKVWDNAQAASTQGPANLELAQQATLKLPADHIYIPQPNATELMKAMGNPGQHTTLNGLVFPSKDPRWFVTINFEPSGYVKDDDAKDWNADDLLKSYKEGTAAANEERKKMGVPSLEIVGWAEKPNYSSAQHTLVWAMSSKQEGATASEPMGVNYNTYALGREGYFTLNLVTDLKDLASLKPTAGTLLSSLQFNEGKRYSDFNASSDRVAEYGLAALVVGLGAKKLGLFAAAAVFLAKFGKIALLAIGGLGALFFKRKGKNQAPAEPQDKA